MSNNSDTVISLYLNTEHLLNSSIKGYITSMISVYSK